MRVYQSDMGLMGTTVDAWRNPDWKIGIWVERSATAMRLLGDFLRAQNFSILAKTFV
jgi:hypothetical protein